MATARVIALAKHKRHRCITFLGAKMISLVSLSIFLYSGSLSQNPEQLWSGSHGIVFVFRYLVMNCSVEHAEPILSGWDVPIVADVSGVVNLIGINHLTNDDWHTVLASPVVRGVAHCRC